MHVSHATLKVLSAAVWYTGAGVLLWKGALRLAAGAAGVPGSAAGSVGAQPDFTVWALAAGGLGLGLGVLQGWTVFRRACVRNLRRIDSLERPRVWQFFRPGFFLALATMVGAAAGLGVVAESGPTAAMAVASLDWLIGFSLLVSSVEFWRVRPAAVEVPGPSVGVEADAA